MKARFCSDIFNDVPAAWGLRGNPYFWKDLQQHFSNIELPYSEHNFIHEIEMCFKKTTGQALTKDCQAYVERYANGGMSGGMVCGSFWIEQGIPMLLARLKKENS